MSIDTVEQWSTTAASNTTLGPTLTLDGAVMKPSEVDNAFRELMAQVATFNATPTFANGIDFTSSSQFVIKPTTIDGADSAAVWILGGGAATTARGAIVIVYGNEGLAPGRVRLIPGSGSYVAVEGPLNIADATGGQIVFPATQNASANANTLDDYEEGTWTPTITAGSGTFTTTSASGTYTKIGNRVFAELTITITTNGTAATDVRATLPFTPSGTATGCGRESASTGLLLSGQANATNVLIIRKYDNLYPGGSGYVISMSVNYIV
jgi:hypothetical protein